MRTMLAKHTYYVPCDRAQGMHEITVHVASRQSRRRSTDHEIVSMSASCPHGPAADAAARLGGRWCVHELVRMREVVVTGARNHVFYDTLLSHLVNELSKAALIVREGKPSRPRIVEPPEDLAFRLWRDRLAYCVDRSRLLHNVVTGATIESASPYRLLRAEPSGDLVVVGPARARNKPLLRKRRGHQWALDKVVAAASASVLCIGATHCLVCSTESFRNVHQHARHEGHREAVVNELATLCHSLNRIDSLAIKPVTPL